MDGSGFFSWVMRSKDYDHTRELELQAIVLMEDGLAFRSIHHVLNNVQSLQLYRFHKKGFVKKTVSVLIACLLLLIFIERPSSFSLSSEPVKQNQESVLRINDTTATIVEGILLLLISCDLLVDFFLERSSSGNRKVWIFFHVLFVGFSIIELLVNSAVDENLMYRKMLRPYFMIRRSTVIKKMLKCILSSLKELIAVLLMLFVTLTLFTAIAYAAFSSDENSPEATEGSAYFLTFMKGLENMLVLGTTANNPTVIMPAFSKNRLSALFFMFYLLIFVILTNILIAILYTHFTSFFEDRVKNAILRRRVAFKAAFCCLQELEVEVSHYDSFERTESKVTLEKPMFKPKGPEIVVHSSKIEACIREMEVKDQNRKQKLLAEIQRSSELWYTYEKFLKLIISHLESPRETSSFCPIIKASTPFLCRVQAIMIRREGIWIDQIIAYLFVFLQFVVLVKYGTDEKYCNMEDGVRWTILSLCALLSISCIVHSSLLLWAFGVKRYVRSWARNLDFICTIAIVLTVAAEIMEVSFSLGCGTNSALIIIRKLGVFIVVCKLMASMVYVKQVQLIMNVGRDLGTNLMSFAGVMVSAYYSFAVLGMILFQEVIPQPSINGIGLNSKHHPNNTFYPSVPAPCGSYEQLGYWATNFNDFYASIVLLWDIMIVNNWNVFLDVYTRYTRPTSKIFFVTWWLISNVILLNLLTSLTIESLMVRLKVTSFRDKKRQLVDSAHVVVSAPTNGSHSNEGVEMSERSTSGTISAGDAEDDSMQGRITYSSIYEMFWHSREMPEPASVDVTSIAKSHPEKQFVTMENIDYRFRDSVPLVSSSLSGEDFEHERGTTSGGGNDHYTPFQ